MRSKREKHRATYDQNWEKGGSSPVKMTDDPNDPVQQLSGDAATDNRMSVTEPDENTMALQAMQANSGMFMHPMHDVTQTDHIHGDKVLEQLQTDLAKLEAGMEVGAIGATDSNETYNEDSR